DAEVTPADIAAWERRHGRLPDGACVAMRSGWDRHVGGPRLRTVGADGRTTHFPGFNLGAGRFLLEQRRVVGIAVVRPSLDVGASRDVAGHDAWLPTGRRGPESAANPGDLPAAGATIVVGSPKPAGATGGPSRVFALV
ncbi:MAG: cyclase family protein, partial [Acetobacteraceae bacterium]